MRSFWPLALIATFPLGCATTRTVPVEQLTDSRAAIRAAEEMGANEVPAAKQHLDLARLQTQRANSLLSQGEDRRAAFLLERATADAELAMSLAREQPTRIEAQRLLDQVKAIQDAGGAR